MHEGIYVLLVTQMAYYVYIMMRHVDVKAHSFHYQSSPRSKIHDQSVTSDCLRLDICSFYEDGEHMVCHMTGCDQAKGLAPHLAVSTTAQAVMTPQENRES